MAIRKDIRANVLAKACTLSKKGTVDITEKAVIINYFGLPSQNQPQPLTLIVLGDSFHTGHCSLEDLQGEWSNSYKLDLKPTSAEVIWDGLPNRIKNLKVSSLIALMSVSHAQSNKKGYPIEHKDCANVFIGKSPYSENYCLASMDFSTGHILEVDAEVKDKKTVSFFNEEWSPCYGKIPFYLKSLLAELPKNFEADLEFKIDPELKYTYIKYGFLIFIVRQGEHFSSYLDYTVVTPKLKGLPATVGIDINQWITMLREAKKELKGKSNSVVPFVKRGDDLILSIGNEALTKEYPLGVGGQSNYIPTKGLINVESLLNQLLIVKRVGTDCGYYVWFPFNSSVDKQRCTTLIVTNTPFLDELTKHVSVSYMDKPHHLSLEDIQYEKAQFNYWESQQKK